LFGRQTASTSRFPLHDQEEFSTYLSDLTYFIFDRPIFRLYRLGRGGLFSWQVEITTNARFADAAGVTWNQRRFACTALFLPRS
jgi:hypothetical protein